MYALTQPAAHAGIRALFDCPCADAGDGVAQPATLANRTDGTDGAVAERQEFDPLLPPDMGRRSWPCWCRNRSHAARHDARLLARQWRRLSLWQPDLEPYLAPNGYYSQAFERGIFQYLPEYQWTDDPTVRLQPIGGSELNVNRDTTRADGRRVAGDRRAARTLPGVNSTERQEDRQRGRPLQPGDRFQHLRRFGAWFDNHEGWFYLGAPISSRSSIAA